MSHKILLAEGKISRTEYRRLVKYKVSNPGLYQILENQYRKRPKFYTRHGKRMMIRR